MPVGARFLGVGLKLLLLSTGHPLDADEEERLERQALAMRMWRMVGVGSAVLAIVVGGIAGASCGPPRGTPSSTPSRAPGG